MNVSIFSTPMVSTWAMIEELRRMTDAGDGVVALLGGKVLKADTIAVTHPDRDHLGGLLQLCNLRGRGLRVLYPSGSGSFPALRDFLSKFDPDSSAHVEWIPVEPGQRLALKAGWEIEPFLTDHMPGIKSVGYKVIESKRKLRPEYVGMDGADIGRIRSELGEDAVTTRLESLRLVFSGDGLALGPDALAGAEVLFQECTFLDEVSSREHKHPNLAQVVEFVDRVRPKEVILYHISPRYSDEEIVAAVDRAEWPCPVKVILPGRLHRGLVVG